MERLIQIVREYQRARTLGTRLKVAEQIVRLIAGELRAAIYVKCREEQIVDDLLQEVLMAVTDALDGFQGEADKQFWRLCHRIVSRKVADHFRRAYAEPPKPSRALDDAEFWRAVEAGAAEASLSPADLLAYKELVQTLQQLPHPCFDYVWQRLIVGLSFVAIGRGHQKAAAAVRMAYHRCLETAKYLLLEHL